MDIACCIGVGCSDTCGQVVDHGDDDIAGVHRLGGNRRTVVELGSCDRPDRLNTGGWHDTNGRLRRGESRLDLQQLLELGVVGELRSDVWFAQ